MPLYNVAILAFVTLLTMVNPLAVIPSFVAMTDGFTTKQRRRIALTASFGAATILALFFLAGNYVFKLFGITVPAFQIMGGIIFFTNARRTLVEDDRRIRNISGGRRSEEEIANEVPHLDPHSVAIVPLAIPMLAGPGAITSTMVLVNLYPQVPQKLAILIAIAAVGAAAHLALLAAVPLSRVFGERGRAVFSKVMALMLGAIGVQFVLNGLKPLMLEIVKASAR